MAIDDNTLYGLTGAQVKDLAGKVEAKADSSSLATVATSGSYNDLSNKPTIPTVNNATLTIQKNGTTVKTFTANASSNVTANITVPTKTSDLTNDSSYVTTTAMNTALADKADNSDIPTALSELTNDINAVSDSNYVHTDNNYTTAEKNKLSGIASGAEVNQNAFSNVKVGSTTVAADSKTDTLELVAGNNITLTPDATNDKVTVTGKDQIKTNSNLSPTADTVTAWKALFADKTTTGVDKTEGYFVTWYTVASKFDNQPSQYGFLETLIAGNDVYQRWKTQNIGHALYRSGNVANSWTDPGNGKFKQFNVGNSGSYYATSTTAADAAAKVASLDNAPDATAFRLETGARVSVKFTNANTYNGTATLNVGGTGAKNIVYIGSDSATRYTWRAGEVVDFIYDGTNWVEVNGGVADTTYYGVTKLVNSVASTSTSMAATPNSVKQAYDLASSKPDITMTDTDPGEGSPLADNSYIGVYDDSAELVFIGDVLSSPTDTATMITRKVLYTSSAYSTVVSSITLSESVASYDALEITFNQKANAAGRQSTIPSELFGAFLLSLVRADSGSVGMFGAYCSASGTTLRLEAGGGVAFSSQSTPSGFTNALETVITKVVGIKYS